MKDFLTLAQNDLRMLWRTGYVWATIVVFALLLLIASQVARLEFAGFAELVAAIILFDAVLSPVLVIGLMMLLERGEGSFIALAVTPVSRWAYVAARTATVSAICASQMLLLVLITYDGALSPALLLAGLLGVAAIASLLAFVAVAPFDGLYPFMLPMIGWIFFLGAPGYAVLLGWDPLWFSWHPTAAPKVLLEGAFAALPIGRLAYGVVGTMAWLALGAVLAERALRRMQLSAGGR
jgi:hypothetical protein